MSESSREDVSRAASLRPEAIEALRKGFIEFSNYQAFSPSDEEINLLCELALDGLRFRMWIAGAVTCPSALVRALSLCTTPAEYRKAIDGLIASGKLKP